MRCANLSMFYALWVCMHTAQCTIYIRVSCVSKFTSLMDNNGIDSIFQLFKPFSQWTTDIHTHNNAHYYYMQIKPTKKNPIRLQKRNKSENSLRNENKSYYNLELDKVKQNKTKREEGEKTATTKQCTVSLYVSRLITNSTYKNNKGSRDHTRHSFEYNVLVLIC